jgi:peptidoglycan/LPS O-acetylase OafA/YrhL
VRYRPEIDGLRAVAVIPVILYHAGFEFFSGGFIGVDVFFVLSGYLITSILLGEHEYERFSLVGFYERRARRILPALFFVMAATIPFAWIYLWPQDLKDFSQSIVAVSTFASNILFWTESDYFDAAAELKPLLHTWSLAVEEQFYVLFPLFLAVTWRFGKRQMSFLVAAVAALSLVAAEWASIRYPSASFYLLPTRAWELLLGALVAIYMFKKTAIRGNQSLSVLGLAVLAFSILAFDEQTPFPGLIALIPTIGVVFVVMYTREGMLVHKALSNRLLVGVGLISYSAYLWHQPIFAFSHHRSIDEPTVGLLIGLIALTFALSWASWQFVERPFRDKRRFTRNQIFVSALSVSGLFLLIGVVGHASNGFPGRFEYPSLPNYVFDNRALQRDSWLPLRELSRDERYGVDNNSFDNQSWFSETESPKILLVGNSHSKDLYNLMLSSEEARAAFEFARYGTQISELEGKVPSLFQLPNYVKADVIMIATRYDRRDIEALPGLIRKVRLAGKLPVIVSQSIEFQNYNSRTLADSIVERIVRLQQGGVIDKDELVERINTTYTSHYQDGNVYRGGFISDANTALRNIAMETNAIFLDRVEYLCGDKGTQCFGVSKDLKKLFFDEAHYTLDGARFFGARVDAEQWLHPVVQRIAER